MSPLFILTATLLALITLAVVGDRSKSPIVRWIAILVPPIPMFLLAFVPIDLITFIIWVVAFIFVVYAFGKLIIVASCYIYRQFRNVASTSSGNPNRLIRPVLLIVGFGVSRTLVGMSQVSANAYAIDLAMNAQKEMTLTHRCPSQPAKRFYGTYGTKYPILFNCNDHENTFNFKVRVNHDVSFDVSRTADGTIQAKYGHWSADPVIIEITQNTDLDALASMELDN